VGIIDFDVHFGNGIASMVAGSPDIRYTSLHELGIFPNDGDPGLQGDLKNVFNVGVPYGCKGDAYLKLLEEKSLPFIKEFEPDLVIVSAGYDALGGDPLANINLKPVDYGQITRLIKENFGAVVFGLEGGYSLEGLPHALKSTILEYC
jgi:acetoin utilization deacetylase AcuC-like enzyme